MKKEGYTLFTQTSYLYTFVSVGKKGDILKGIFFDEITTGTFNLALVDYNTKEKTWTDAVSSDNGDLVKVMATVINATAHFLQTNPQAIVYFRGSTSSRQKLYNRIMRNYAEELFQDFVILGENDDTQEVLIFGKPYEAFYIYNKIQ